MGEFKEMTNKASTKYCCMRKDCVYHPAGGNRERGTCDYLSITGHRRGCSIVECTRYQTGKRIRQCFQSTGVMVASEAQRMAFMKNLGVAIANKFPSRAEFARAIGVAATTVAYYCNGKGLPKPETMKTICEVLGMSEEELFEVKE